MGLVVSGVGGFGDGGVWWGCGGGVVLAETNGVWVWVSCGVVVDEICCVVLVSVLVDK